MRIVVDTNVLVSGLINPQGKPGRIVQQLFNRNWNVCWDDRVLAEYHRVLYRPKFDFEPTEVAELLTSTKRFGLKVQAHSLSVQLPDPKALSFLEVAVAGQADFLITGNLKDFPVENRHGIQVVAPAEFLHGELQKRT